SEAHRTVALSKFQRSFTRYQCSGGRSRHALLGVSNSAAPETVVLLKCPIAMCMWSAVAAQLVATVFGGVPTGVDPQHSSVWQKRAVPEGWSETLPMLSTAGRAAVHLP